MRNGTPKIVTAENVDVSLKSELNDFIEKVDDDYKKIIEKHGVGECLTFFGQLKK